MEWFGKVFVRLIESVLQSFDFPCIRCDHHHPRLFSHLVSPYPGENFVSIDSWHYRVDHQKIETRPVLKNFMFQEFNRISTAKSAYDLMSQALKVDLDESDNVAFVAADQRAQMSTLAS